MEEKEAHVASEKALEREEEISCLLVCLEGAVVACEGHPFRVETFMCTHALLNEHTEARTFLALGIEVQLSYGVESAFDGVAYQHLKIVLELVAFLERLSVLAFRHGFPLGEGVNESTSCRKHQSSEETHLDSLDLGVGSKLFQHDSQQRMAVALGEPFQEE